MWTQVATHGRTQAANCDELCQTIEENEARVKHVRRVCKIKWNQHGLNSSQYKSDEDQHHKYRVVRTKYAPCQAKLVQILVTLMELKSEMGQE